MAFDAFLQIDGVNGESTRDKFEKSIEILSFSWGAMNPVSVGSGGSGLGAGKASLTSFNVMKLTDAASPLLFQACCTGKHFDKAKVTLHKAGGDSAVDYLVYDFEDVMVESVQWSGSSGGDDRPTESMSLAYGKVTITYSPQAKKGEKEAKPVIGSWDQRTVKK